MKLNVCFQPAVCRRAWKREHPVRWRGELHHDIHDAFPDADGGAPERTIREIRWGFWGMTINNQTKLSKTGANR